MSLFSTGRDAGTTLPVESHLPGFDGATEWLNSEPLDAADLDGKVVLVDFWTYTCINWLRTLGYVRAWSEKYADRGMALVSVHTPEFWFEHDVDNIRKAVEDLDVEFPIAVDSDYAIWRAFANRYWPALYIADAEGRIRHHQFGEGGYEECELIIQQLLRDAGREDVPSGLVSVPDEGIEAQADWSTLETPETYLGSNQAQNFVRGEPDELDLNHWSLTGDWAVEPHASILNEPNGQIRFRFHARDVNLVLRAQEPPVPFRVFIDGQPPGEARGLDVDREGRGTLVEPRLYQLIRQHGPIEDRTFEITFDAPGVEGYSFTFG
jgi:thiol-disulfide isomerase/thioredoxin